MKERECKGVKRMNEEGNERKGSPLSEKEETHVKEKQRADE